jgi:hypothetical protein
MHFRKEHIKSQVKRLSGNYDKGRQEGTWRSKKLGKIDYSNDRIGSLDSKRFLPEPKQRDSQLVKWLEFAMKGFAANSFPIYLIFDVNKSLIICFAFWIDLKIHLIMVKTFYPAFIDQNWLTIVEMTEKRKIHFKVELLNKITT